MKIDGLIFGFLVIFMILGCGEVIHSNENNGVNSEEDLNKIKKTGQVNSIVPYDDGYYEKGIEINFIRDDVNEIVLNSTNLMWQDNVDVTIERRNWSSANNYCQNLNFANYVDWRLPTIIELENLVDFGESNQAINTVFVNSSNTSYWSSNTKDNLSDAWCLNFRDGVTMVRLKSFLYLARCVRSK